MQQLWSPWRSQYIESFSKPGENSCFLCNAAETTDSDEELLVVHRSKFCFAILNRYPYNSGHLLIAPYRHVGDYLQLSDDELKDITSLSQKFVNIMQQSLHPHGFNIGFNIGQVAGAGLPGHIHLHIVPRWNGDSNFISVLSETKVISSYLQDTYKQFKELIDF